MKKLINEDNDIILDGTATRAEKTKEAFEKLGALEDILSMYDIESLEELDDRLYELDCIKHANEIRKLKEEYKNGN